VPRTLQFESSTLPGGVTIVRHFTTSSANDRGDDGFFLGVLSMMSADTSRRLESINATYAVERKKKIVR